MRPFSDPLTHPYVVLTLIDVWSDVLLSCLFGTYHEIEGAVLGV